MCVHWYFAKHFPELSYHFLTRSKGRILTNCAFRLIIGNFFFKKFLFQISLPKPPLNPLQLLWYLLDVSPWINHFIDKNLG